MVRQLGLRPTLLLLAAVLIASCGPGDVPDSKTTTFTAPVAFEGGAVSDGSGTVIGGSCSDAEAGKGECVGDFLVYCGTDGSPRRVSCIEFGPEYTCAAREGGIDCVVVR